LGVTYATETLDSSSIPNCIKPKTLKRFYVFEKMSQITLLMQFLLN